MEAIIETKALQQAVKQAGKAIGGKSSPWPAVRIQAGKEGLSFDATNSDTYGHTSVECITSPDKGPDTVIVSSSLLAKLSGKLPAGEVFMSSAVGQLTIGGAVVPTMALEDFPDTPRIEGALLVGVFPGDVFKGLAKRLKAASIKAASTTRIALTGVNIVSGAGRVKFAATDGHRLLLEEYATGCSESGAVLVNAAELARIATLVKIADIVRLEVVPAPTDRSGYANRARLVVSFSSATYQLRGISEEFPDFERVIPSGAGVKFTIGRRLFASAIARGGIVANDAGAVTLALESGSSVLSMSSGSRDKGNYSESLRLSAPTWESCAPVSFSGAYIADVLKLGKSGSVSVTLGAPLQAALFSTDGDTVPGRTRQAWVLMPLNPDDV